MVRGVVFHLLKSYKGHRHQYVNLNGYCSDIKAITSGVPQVSILGPLLFNLYINDIVNVIHSAEFIIYADDVV